MFFFVCPAVCPLLVMDSSFFNNPFACLAQLVEHAKAPAKNSPCTQHGVPVSTPVPQEDVHECVIHDAADSALFLQSVARMARNTSPHCPPAFSLADNVPSFQRIEQKFGREASLTSMQKKHKKRRKAPSGHADSGQKKVIASYMPQSHAEEPSFAKLLCVDDSVHEFQAAMQNLKGVLPLAGGGRDIAPEIQGVSAHHQGEDDFQRMLEGKLEFALALKGEYLEGYVMGLDPIVMENLRAGNYSPEAHIDLHGLNAMQAYRALVDFFRLSWFKGLRVVLVVPGRGKNSINGFAVLRDKLQSWLTQDPFKKVVLAFCTAQAVDGGPGSVYVLLRKYKKKGKIYWERMPADIDLF